MIIVLKREATEEIAKEILARIEEKGLKPLYMPGSERVVLGALGDERVLAELGLDGHPMVESIKPILSPYKLVSRDMHPHDTVVRFGAANIGVLNAFSASARNCPLNFSTMLKLLNTERSQLAWPGPRMSSVRARLRCATAFAESSRTASRHAASASSPRSFEASALPR